MTQKSITIDGLLNTIKQRHNITSDYKLSLFLGIGQGNIANYRHKRSMPNAEACEKIATALGMDPDYLIVHFEAQRAPSEEAKAMWLRIAARLQAGAVHTVLLMIAAMVSIAGYAPNAEATALSPTDAKVSSVYYVK